ncbi:MAG: hypothetical protein IT457_21145 [Planctomycetes bacterium]|nr:hypothetical protein [Planctomycetota bacterium]
MATFFLDHSLGRRTVADAIRAAGHEVEVLTDHFPQGVEDHVWIERCAKRRWIALMGDKLRRNDLARVVIRECGAWAFCLAGRRAEASGVQKAGLFIAAVPEMIRLSSSHRFVFGSVESDGGVRVIEAG